MLDRHMVYRPSQPRSQDVDIHMLYHRTLDRHMLYHPSHPCSQDVDVHILYHHTLYHQS